MLEYFLATEIKVDFNYCSHIRLKTTTLKMSQRRPYQQQHLIVMERQTEEESRKIISEESRAEMRIYFFPQKSEEKNCILQLQIRSENQKQGSSFQENVTNFIKCDKVSQPIGHIDLLMSNLRVQESTNYRDSKNRGKN